MILSTEIVSVGGFVAENGRSVDCPRVLYCEVLGCCLFSLLIATRRLFWISR